MLDLATRLFSLVCGQNPEHTWAPGGVLLPFCQRCTGLYIGAMVGVAMHLAGRNRKSLSQTKPTSSPCPSLGFSIPGRLLLIHGFFLLQMIPFGYHWLPQGPVLRTETGVLFGFGVATFLGLLPATVWGSPFTLSGSRSYWAGVIGTILLLPILVQWGGSPGARVVMVLGCGGLLALAGLAAFNLFIIGAGLVRRRRGP
jgi:uncharacterized membrane protein